MNGPMRRSKSSSRRLLGVVALVLTVMALSACRSDLHHDLIEAEANEIVAALDEQGIAASKERDDGRRERWMISVADGDSRLAWRTLEAAGLPRRSSQTFEDLYPRSGLLPSRSEEHVLLQTATAGKLEESLRSVDGVLDARVHLVLPQPSSLGARGATPTRPKASVLVRVTKGGAAGVDKEMVANLVAFGSPELETDRVDVTIVSMGGAETIEDPIPLASLGPLRVAPNSRGPLRASLAILGLCVLLLTAGFAMQTIRLHRLRGERTGLSAESR
jgi:type III secretion protein J